jgi:tetratricopeptide (TPR) repeat protein
MLKEKNDPLKTESKTFATAGPAGDKPNMVAQMQSYIENNRKMVMGVSVGIIIVVIAVFLGKNWIEKTNEEKNINASFALSKVLPYIMGNDFEKALNGDKQALVNGKPVIGLVEIVKNYEGTKPGKVAALYAGNCFISLNKYAEAVKYFKISAESESAIIMEGANSGLGACSETDGKFEEAIQHYEKAVLLSKTPGTRNRYQYFQGLCYEKIGQKDKAEKIYREIVAENGSEFVGMAKGGLIRIGTIIE